MSAIKSFSVGNGDMFYVEHASDNFTIIDCCIDDISAESILGEISRLSKAKGITRFISTHPDEDHLQGLERLDDKISIWNFYVVQNAATKDDETDSFKRYRKLRDGDKAFYIYKGCSRKWMNKGDEPPGRGQSGIEILWPDTSSDKHAEALQQAADGEAFNNMSAVIKYSLQDGVTALWMGDLETDYMEDIEEKLDIPEIDILFAPHHGRDSGKVPCSLLEKMKPKLIVIGEAPSEHLNYYAGYNTITQNSAGDIIFDCVKGKCHIFVLNRGYEVDYLDDEAQSMKGYYYIGTLKVG